MKEKGFFKMILSGTGIGVIFSLVAVLIFAFIVNACGLNSGVVRWVNQFVKFVAVFVGCFFALKGRFGYLKGALTGLLIFVITYLIFAAIVGTYVFDARFFIDAAFGLIAGAISGIIAVNVKRRA